MGGLDLGRVLCALLLGLGTRRLCLVERLLDRLAALVHLGHERLVEKLGKEKQEEKEIEGLNDERLVEADQAAALAGEGHRRDESGRKDNEGKETAHREFSGGTTL